MLKAALLGVGIVAVLAAVAAAQPYNLSYGRDYRLPMDNHPYGSSSYYGCPNYYRATDYWANLASVEPFAGWRPASGSPGPMANGDVGY
jgi:hypothetical protein